MKKEYEEKDTTVVEGNTKKKKKKKTKAQRIRGHIIRFDIAIVILVALYLTVAFSHIPFIEKWRTLYIETAMTTGSHQWLATMLFPPSVIDEVMDRYYAQLEKQQSMESKWSDKDDNKTVVDDAKEQFFATYWELDSPSVRSYLEMHKELTVAGYDKILIEDFDEKLGLKTSEGDPIYAINTANNLIIVIVRGEGYEGKLAIVKDASQVKLCKSKSLGSWGQEIDSFCADNNGILGINASRFLDVGGHGKGGRVLGSLIIDGTEYGNTPKKYGMKFCGMKMDNHMYICNYDAKAVSEYRWGMHGLPALIIDGETAIDGSFGMGIQPRSCIGQASNGDMLLLVIDGRQPPYSIGCTIIDCNQVLFRYRCYQAMNLDGGSSAVMCYDGNLITKSSSASGRGRYNPDAFVVTRVSN